MLAMHSPLFGHPSLIWPEMLSYNLYRGVFLSTFFFKPKNLSENQCFFVALFVEEPRWGRNIETPGLGFATFTGFLLEGFRLLEGKGNQSPHWPVERNGIPKPGNVVYMVLLYGCFLI